MHRSVAFAAVVALSICGCATPHQIMDRDDYLAEAAREYPEADREQLIRAAEAVLIHSDPKDWEFRYTPTGFTGIRRYMVYAVLAMSQGQEKWQFATEPGSPGNVRAYLSVEESGVSTGGYVSTPYDNKMASIALYRLFWARVDYMLGRRSDWWSCGDAAAHLRKTRTNEAAALSGLCGATSEGANAPPPKPLGARTFPEMPPAEIPTAPAPAG